MAEPSNRANLRRPPEFEAHLFKSIPKEWGDVPEGTKLNVYYPADRSGLPWDQSLCLIPPPKTGKGSATHTHLYKFYGQIYDLFFVKAMLVMKWTGSDKSDISGAPVMFRTIMKNILANRKVLDDIANTTPNQLQLMSKALITSLAVASVWKLLKAQSTGDSAAGKIAKYHEYYRGDEEKEIYLAHRLILSMFNDTNSDRTWTIYPPKGKRKSWDEGKHKGAKLRASLEKFIEDNSWDGVKALRDNEYKLVEKFDPNAEAAASLKKLLQDDPKRPVKINVNYANHCIRTDTHDIPRTVTELMEFIRKKIGRPEVTIEGIVKSGEDAEEDAVIDTDEQLVDALDGEDAARNPEFEVHLLEEQHAVPVQGAKYSTGDVFAAIGRGAD